MAINEGKMMQFARMRCLDCKMWNHNTRGGKEEEGKRRCLVRRFELDLSDPWFRSREQFVYLVSRPTSRGHLNQTGTIV